MATCPRCSEDHDFRVACRADAAEMTATQREQEAINRYDSNRETARQQRREELRAEKERDARSRLQRALRYLRRQEGGKGIDESDDNLKGN